MKLLIRTAIVACVIRELSLLKYKRKRLGRLTRCGVLYVGEEMA